MAIRMCHTILLSVPTLAALVALALPGSGRC